VHKGSISNGTGGALLAYPYDVFVSGNYAYVASSESSALEIIDVSNPAVPVHKGSISNGTGGALLDFPTSVFVSGNYAYVTSYSSDALEIVDVSNPAAPVHKGSISDGTGGAILAGADSVFISGNYAYVTSYLNDALEIVEINSGTSSSVTGTGVVVASSNKITCTFPLTGVPIGQYNVVVTNPDAQQGTLINGFAVTNTTTSDKIGIFRPSTHLFYLDYNGNGVWNGAVVDKTYNFGITGDIPVSGDWNNDTISEIGIFRPSTHLFYLDYNGNGAWNGASVDRSYNFGITGDIPITGDWNSDGRPEIGVFRNSTHLFYLDFNGNGAWNGASVDRQYNFGITGDIPISGKW
jgi:hypothetical protein